jgi:hypothetical protein
VVDPIRGINPIPRSEIAKYANAEVSYSKATIVEEEEEEEEGKIEAEVVD